MPGFLGGNSGGGAGGEIRFPAELIDPVTKLRVSQPQTLIDTDFEYGLQPTKWETVELINNTPSFFSKSGDTTIPNLESITTTATSREIKVTTALAHGLAVGIPINVSGTKSLTADGSYIINSVPTITTFTYLAKQNQPDAASIEDLYTSIITGEFFQGSQIKISDSDGIVTNAAGASILTVKTESPHGFGIDTPFYFLNLNSTVSQEFDSSNTSSKAFDSSNSATAQVFDGSNTLTSYRLDLDNNAVAGGVISSVSTFNPTTNQITVAHTTENFVGLSVGSPLYHNIVSAGGYFSTTPRGVVFLKSLDTSTTNGSIFTISQVPNGTVIAIPNALTGTFQKANEARLFAGNNINNATETTITLVEEEEKVFNGANLDGQFLNNCSFSGSNVTGASGSGVADLDLYQGLMVKYETTGAPPTINAGGSALFGGSTTVLVNNRTYFIESSFQVGSSINYVTTLKEFPTSSSNINFTSTGSGTHKFTVIGIAVDKEIFHIKNNGYQVNDMLRYTYGAGVSRFAVNDVATEQKDYYFLQNIYGPHNFDVNWTVGEVSPKIQEYIGLVATQSSVTTQMVAVGFGAGLTFSVTSGTLPAGLNLNTSTGIITGTPSNIAGYATATIRVTAVDSANSTDFLDITFQVNPAPFLYSFTSATFTTGGASGYDGANINQARNGVGNPSWASTYLNMPSYNGQMEWTVPRTATYRVTAQGSGGNSDNYFGYTGGQGARMQGDFTLTQGDIVTIAIGQRGNSGRGGQGCNHNVSGGNGATWVLRGRKYTSAAQSDVMVIAGAGGTPGNYPCCSQNNYTTNANVGTAGYRNAAFGGFMADNGQGAGSMSNYGTGGAGFYSDGQGGATNWYPSAYKNGNAPLRGGYMYTPWGDYGRHGGYGGGGSAGLHSGGSGGWSGGGGGEWCSYLAGGGGGSLNNGSNQSNSIQGGNTDGFVTIQQL